MRCKEGSMPKSPRDAFINMYCKGSQKVAPIYQKTDSHIDKSIYGTGKQSRDDPFGYEDDHHTAGILTAYLFPNVLFLQRSPRRMSQMQRRDALDGLCATGNVFRFVNR